MSALLSPMAALGSAGFLGVADFSGGLAGRRTPLPGVIVGMEVCGLTLLPAAIALLPLEWRIDALAMTFAAGALGGLGLIAFYRAMSLTLIRVVAPITGVIAAALPTVAGVLGGDRLRSAQVAGIVLGLAAIALINGVTRTTSKHSPVGVGLAILAGLSFGVFFILFHAASSAGAAAFLSGRLGSALAGLCAAVVSGASPIALRTALPLVAVSGVLDATGSILYLYASRTGLLSLTALLASFYPAFTIACARLFTRERLTALQTLGAALAVCAVALIAAT
jgi:drug/metabolite transporter (DMT)-like permease